MRREPVLLYGAAHVLALEQRVAELEAELAAMAASAAALAGELEQARELAETFGAYGRR